MIVMMAKGMMKIAAINWEDDSMNYDFHGDY